MKKQLMIVIGIAIIVVVWSISAQAKTLFHDDFNASNLDTIWLLDHNQQQAGGGGAPEWVHANGILSQINPQPGDPTYAVIQGENWPNEYGIMAKVRLDDWQDHDRSRAGVGVWIDENDSYNGYTWLIHERLTTLNMEFLNDHRAWFQQEETFPVEVGKWYWVKMFIDNKKVYGKIWEDGKEEPKNWLSSKDYGNFGGIRKPTSLAGLNGGAGTGGGHSTASFDDVFVFDADGPDPLPVEPKDKLAITWGELKSER